MAARILDKLRQSSFSVEELAFDLKRKPFEILAAIASLIIAGAIIKLVSKREGGPFYHFLLHFACVPSASGRKV